MLEQRKLVIPAAHPVLTRKRGNPNGGRPIPPAPALPTEFELRISQLQLTAEMYTSSAALRNWCERNRNRWYVPEWLLEEWGITVDPTFSAVARPNHAESPTQPPLNPPRPGAYNLATTLHNHAEVPMPQYEFYCHACKKTFTKILTLVDYEAGGVVCLHCGSQKVEQCWSVFSVITSRKSA